MPTREEIAGWLKNASSACYAASYCVEKTEMFVELERSFRERATQVEEMRCGECRNRITTKPTYEGSSSHEIVWCPHFTGNNDFGCWHFERRGGEDE